MDALSKFVPLGQAQLSGLSSAKGLPTVGSPAALPNGPNVIAILSCQAQAVRFRDDGVAPTGSVGFPIAVGQEFTYSGDLTAIQIIEQAPSAVVNIAYYRRVG